MLIELSGADLLAALENGVSQVENATGRFPQVSGMTFSFDPARPAGSRIVEATVGGTPLARDHHWPAAITSLPIKGEGRGGGER